ncbi:hypothetical protein [Aquimarina sp. MAR_2010_214]|uniref:hypothetical protein n=1 Tax=Aquimarina sp. MAR_2010_214 TaxID=1250026 RepID=UPI0011776A50|nr:hypothetical protein [Aquimarina sp. MAR_2010_214]
MKTQENDYGDRLFIERLVEKSYTSGQYIRVTDSGTNVALLSHGVYTVNSEIQKRNLRTLKAIFYGLAMKYKSYEFCSTHYSFYKGKWHQQDMT